MTAATATSNVFPATDSDTETVSKRYISSLTGKDWQRFAEVRALTRQAARLITRQSVRRLIDDAGQVAGSLPDARAHNAAHEIVAELELLYAAAVSAEMERLGAEEFRARVLSHFPEIAYALAKPETDPDPYA